MDGKPPACGAGYVDWRVMVSSSLPAADAGFYSVKADKLNEMLVEPAFHRGCARTAEIETAGYIAGSVNIPIRDLLKNLDKLPRRTRRSSSLVLPVTAARSHDGPAPARYTDVVNLNGGVNGWIKAEFPVEKGAPAAPAAGTAPE